MRADGTQDPPHKSDPPCHVIGEEQILASATSAVGVEDEADKDDAVWLKFEQVCALAIRAVREEATLDVARRIEEE